LQALTHLRDLNEPSPLSINFDSLFLENVYLRKYTQTQCRTRHRSGPKNNSIMKKRTDFWHLVLLGEKCFVWGVAT